MSLVTPFSEKILITQVLEPRDVTQSSLVAPIFCESLLSNCKLINLEEKLKQIELAKKPHSAQFVETLHSSARRRLYNVLTKPHLVNSSCKRYPLEITPAELFWKIIERLSAEGIYSNPALIGSTVGYLLDPDQEHRDMDFLNTIECVIDLNSKIIWTEDGFSKFISKVVRDAADHVRFLVELAVIDLFTARYPQFSGCSFREIWDMYFTGQFLLNQPILMDNEHLGNRFSLLRVGLLFEIKTSINLTLRTEGGRCVTIRGVQEYSAFDKDATQVPLYNVLEGLNQGLVLERVDIVSMGKSQDVIRSELKSRELFTDSPDGSKLFKLIDYVTLRSYHCTRSLAITIFNNFIKEFGEEHLLSKFNKYFILSDERRFGVICAFANLMILRKNSSERNLNFMVLRSIGESFIELLNDQAKKFIKESPALLDTAVNMALLKLVLDPEGKALNKDIMQISHDGEYSLLTLDDPLTFFHQMLLRLKECSDLDIIYNIILPQITLGEGLSSDQEILTAIIKGIERYLIKFEGSIQRRAFSHFVLLNFDFTVASCEEIVLVTPPLVSPISGKILHHDEIQHLLAPFPKECFEVEIRSLDDLMVFLDKYAARDLWLFDFNTLQTLDYPMLEAAIHKAIKKSLQMKERAFEIIAVKLFTLLHLIEKGSGVPSEKDIDQSTSLYKFVALISKKSVKQAREFLFILDQKKLECSEEKEQAYAILLAESLNKIATSDKVNIHIALPESFFSLMQLIKSIPIAHEKVIFYVYRYIEWLAANKNLSKVSLAVIRALQQVQVPLEISMIRQNLILQILSNFEGSAAAAMKLFIEFHPSLKGSNCLKTLIFKIATRYFDESGDEAYNVLGEFFKQKTLEEIVLDEALGGYLLPTYFKWLEYSILPLRALDSPIKKITPRVRKDLLTFHKALDQLNELADRIPFDKPPLYTPKSTLTFFVISCFRFLPQEELTLKAAEKTLNLLRKTLTSSISPESDLWELIDCFISGCSHSNDEKVAALAREYVKTLAVSGVAPADIISEAYFKIICDQKLEECGFASDNLLQEALDLKVFNEGSDLTIVYASMEAALTRIIKNKKYHKERLQRRIESLCVNPMLRSLILKPECFQYRGLPILLIQHGSFAQMTDGHELMITLLRNIFSSYNKDQCICPLSVLQGLLPSCIDLPMGTFGIPLLKEMIILLEESVKAMLKGSALRLNILTLSGIYSKLVFSLEQKIHSITSMEALQAYFPLLVQLNKVFALNKYTFLDTPTLVMYAELEAVSCYFSLEDSERCVKFSTQFETKKPVVYFSRMAFFVKRLKEMFVDLNFQSKEILLIQTLEFVVQAIPLEKITKEIFLSLLSIMKNGVECMTKEFNPVLLKILDQLLSKIISYNSDFLTFAQPFFREYLKKTITIPECVSLSIKILKFIPEEDAVELKQIILQQLRR